MGDFGSRLKKIRQSQKITQKKLAENLKVAQSTIANYENNIRFPRNDTLRNISDTLGISVDYLLGSDPLKFDAKLSPLITAKNLHINFLDFLLKGDIKKAKMLVKEMNLSGVTTTTIIEDLFIPTLKLMGDKWSLNKLSIAEESYITNIIEKLFNFISESHDVEIEKELTALFMVPPGEDHLISLLMSTEYFKIRGWKMRVIGKSIPIDALIKIIREDKIDLVVLCSMTQASINSASYVVSAVRSELKKKTPIILLGGASVNSSDFDLIRSFVDYPINSFTTLTPKIIEIENQLLDKDK